MSSAAKQPKNKPTHKASNKQVKMSKKVEKKVEKKVMGKVKKYGGGGQMARYNPGSDKYLKVLTDPFECQPFPMGFGTAVPTSVQTAFYRSQWTPSSLHTSFALKVTPGVGTGTIFFYSDALNTTNLGTANFVNSVTPVNSAGILATTNQARIIAAGLRVTVRYPATGVRGTLAAIPVYSDTRSNIELKSFLTLSGLEAATWGTGGSGEMNMQVTYRPLDLTSYEFGTYPLSQPAIGAFTPHLLIVGTGWVAGSYTVEVNAIIHVETIGGVINSASDNRCGVASSEDALRASTMAPPAATNLEKGGSGGIIDKLHHFRHVAQSVAGLARDYREIIRSATPSADFLESKEPEQKHDLTDLLKELEELRAEKEKMKHIILALEDGSESEHEKPSIATPHSFTAFKALMRR